jgi:hypothetical protein
MLKTPQVPQTDRHRRDRLSDLVSELVLRTAFKSPSNDFRSMGSDNWPCKHGNTGADGQPHLIPLRLAELPLPTAYHNLFPRFIRSASGHILTAGRSSKGFNWRQSTAPRFGRGIPVAPLQRINHRTWPPFETDSTEYKEFSAPLRSAASLFQEMLQALRHGCAFAL